MYQYFARRFLLALLTLLLITFVVYGLIRLMPGDPLLVALENASPDHAIRAEDRERMREIFGLNDPWYIAYWHWLTNVVVGIGLLAYGGIPYVLWGIFFRTTAGLHATWLVNSATHKWGSRRFHTHDDSTNNWWVALLTFGEGWHNNHHAHPTSARHGLAWYEVDINWMGISVLRALGLAWDVRLARIAQSIPYEENDRLVVDDRIVVGDQAVA